MTAKPDADRDERLNRDDQRREENRSHGSSQRDPGENRPGRGQAQPSPQDGDFAPGEDGESH